MEIFILKTGYFQINLNILLIVIKVPISQCDFLILDQVVMVDLTDYKNVSQSQYLIK